MTTVARITLRERLASYLLRVQPGEIPTLVALGQEIAQIRMEWAEMLDFIQTWAGRQAKRDANLAKKALAAPLHDEVPAGEVPIGQLDKSELRRRAAAQRGLIPTGRSNGA